MGFLYAHVNVRLPSMPSGMVFCFDEKGKLMESRIGAISIIVEEPESVEALNNVLHEYASCILGRMGIPYREKGINIISVAVDAPENEITALSGKIGRLAGVSTKTAYSRIKK